MPIHPNRSLPLARQITTDEVAAYHTAGVVFLRGVLSLQTVNLIRNGIDHAVATLATSQAGYDYSQLASAYEANDAETLLEASSGQHDIAGIVQYMRELGSTLLFDDVANRKGRFIIDTSVSRRISTLHRIVQHGALPEISAALLGAQTVQYFGDQIFVKEPGTRERTAFHQDASYFPIDGYQLIRQR